MALRNWKQSYRHTQKLWISSWWQAYPCHRGRLAPGPQSLRQKVRQGRQVSVLISSRANYFNGPKRDVVLLLSAILFCWTSEIMKLTHNCNWRNSFCIFFSWHYHFWGRAPSKNLRVFSWFFFGNGFPSFPGSRKIWVPLSLAKPVANRKCWQMGEAHASHEWVGLAAVFFSVWSFSLTATKH